MDGLEGFDPAAQVGDAIFGRPLKPEMITGEIEVAGAAGDADALLDAVQKFILSQFLPDLAMQGMHAVHQGIELIEKLAQARPIDPRGVFQRRQSGHLPFQLLHDLGLQVGAIEDIQDIEQAGQCVAAIPFRPTFETREKFIEQEFQPQECAYSFTEGLFVNYVWHDASLK